MGKGRHVRIKQSVNCELWHTFKIYEKSSSTWGNSAQLPCHATVSRTGLEEPSQGGRRAACAIAALPT